MTVESCRAHLDQEWQEILRYIHARHNTVRLLKRRTGLPERRVQRRITELLEMQWIEQIGRLTEPGVYLRVFGLTEEGKRNVPSGLGGSTVKG